MGQRPILKGGIVINVIEIDSDTQIVTKPEAAELAAAEDADYKQRLDLWRVEIKGRREEVEAALGKLALARATVSALKTQAASEKSDAKAAALLRQILAVEEDVAINEKAVRALDARPLPAKPVLKRGKRWFHADGLTVGPAGGNVGDIWDGKSYTKPPEAARVADAEKVAAV